VVLVVLVLLAASAAAYIGYRNLGTAPIEAESSLFSQHPGNAMAVTIDVSRDDPGRPGVCIVRVRNISGVESGRREVYVPPGHERLTTVVRSIGKPVTADVFGCSYEIPSYLSRP
jgi:hypothetical protein